MPDNMNDIVKKGYLFVKRPPSATKLRLKTWQKRFLILRDNMLGKSASLELYESSVDFSAGSKEYFTFDLRHVAHVGSYNDSKRYPQAIAVTLDGHSPLILASDKEELVAEWLVAIKYLAEKEKLCKTDGQTDVSVPLVAPRPAHSLSSPHFTLMKTKSSTLTKEKYQRLPVRVQTNCSSLRNKLSGDYVMQVRTDTIVLLDDSGLQVCTWLLANLKKFKTEDLNGDQVVTLESGLHSKSGEGKFVFRTKHGVELVRMVKDAMQKLNQRRFLSQAALFNSELQIPTPLSLGANSHSSPNLADNSLIGRSWSSSSGSSAGRPSPPPVPPRTHPSAESTSSTGGVSYLDLLDELSVFQLLDEDPSIHYACLDGSIGSSDEEQSRLDDSGYGESSDEICLSSIKQTEVTRRRTSPPRPARARSRISGESITPGNSPRLSQVLGEDGKPVLPPRKPVFWFDHH